MRVEILMSVMNQTDMKLAEQCNADTDVLMINQCDKEDYQEEIYNGHKIRMISTTERGLSKSRNMAIKNALGDILVIADDDLTYKDGYKDAILKAFDKEKKADAIAFNVHHTILRHKRKTNKKFKKALPWKSYCSVSLAFKRRKILEHNVFFNANFGAGSGVVSSGEESVWQHDLRKKGLKIYQHPFCIAEVSQAESTWFSGYDEKFFYDKGYYLAEVMPTIKYFMKYYYIYRLKNVSKLSVREQIKWLNSGIRGHKNELSYEKSISKTISNGK